MGVTSLSGDRSLIINTTKTKKNKAKQNKTKKHQYGKKSIVRRLQLCMIDQVIKWNKHSKMTSFIDYLNNFVIKFSIYFSSHMRIAR